MEFTSEEEKIFLSLFKAAQKDNHVKKCDLVEALVRASRLNEQ